MTREALLSRTPLSTTCVLLAATLCAWTTARADAARDAREAAAPLPIPEYETGQAIVVHIGGLASYVERGPGGLELLKPLLDAGFPRILVIDDAPEAEYASTRRFLRELPTLLVPGADRVRVWTTSVASPGSRFVRDWFPLALRQGTTSSFMDFKYFQGGDETAAAFLASAKSSFQSSARNFEGGNFAATSDGTCFLGEGGASVRPAKFQAVHEDLARFGCRRTVYLPSMQRKNAEGTYVGTNHIDMWMKVAADDLAFVAELDPVQLADYRRHPDKYLRVLSRGGDVDPRFREFVDADIEGFGALLDEGAAILESAGLRVVRVPHPLPLRQHLPLINGVQAGKRIVLSSFPASPTNSGGADAPMFQGVLARARAAVEAEGFEVSYLDASPLIGGSGALHCATSSLPVEVVDAVPTTLPKAAPLPRFCRIASPDGSMNLRTSPSATGRLIATVPNGTGFMKVADAGAWARIEVRLDGVLQGNADSPETDVYVSASGISCP